MYILNNSIKTEVPRDHTAWFTPDKWAPAEGMSVIAEMENGDVYEDVWAIYSGGLEFCGFKVKSELDDPAEDENFESELPVVKWKFNDETLKEITFNIIGKKEVWPPYANYMDRENKNYSDEDTEDYIKI